MALQVEDLEDQSKYRELLKISYDELIDFVLDYLRKKSEVMTFFWVICILFFGIAITVRINIAGYFHLKNIIFHSVLGLIAFPLLIIPFHELLHIITYLIAGAKRIRVGMDLKQFMFYVTAHRFVTGPGQFKLVALTPFVVVNAALLLMILLLPGIWKWSLSLLLFVHATMCVGDFAMLNFYYIHKGKKIYTWDDFDKKTAYFYEKL